MYDKIVQLKIPLKDGKNYATDCAGTPKCAAFDGLKNEVESAWRSRPVTTSSSTRTI